MKQSLLSRLLPTRSTLLLGGSLLGLAGLSFAITEKTSQSASYQSSTSQFHEFWQQSGRQDFSSWIFNSATIASDGSLRLAPGSGYQNCYAAYIDGGRASYDNKARICAGRDPFAAGAYNQQNYYNGGQFYYGAAVSPIHNAAQPINSLIPSWNATTPTGTWIQTHVRILVSGNWSRWYKLPIWASDLNTVKRHSIDGQDDGFGTVDTDTFRTKGYTVTSYQLAVTLCTTSLNTSPSVYRLAAVASHETDAQYTPQVNSDQGAWGKNLNVPQRSQMLAEYKGKDYGGGGEVWCSPTSTSMVLAYWSSVLNRQDLVQTVPDTARDTYDFTYQGTGNWPFNTAYAGSKGLTAYVTRMYSMSQIEQWIKAGVPVIISIGFRAGELPKSPVSSTDGHIIVVRGFASNGDVIVNDPAAASNDGVQITYNRQALQNAWLRSSHGTVYIITPENWQVPTANRLTNW
ncbi:peptidase C39 family protein [Ktedonospora formicarum]|uniref:Peptidase C39-like domain-containing protein n=1 Tax=Ktedonospora formicarum TaxID=2778364 RepID=A0A8J3HYP7_9CHLR|nr:peptidase C39 family protein [Ktedonospora formicarum]GHO43448.1 hypothetical protein KSX_16110 [Ktedonospora formicarum]